MFQVPAQTPNDEAVQQVAPQVLNLHVILGMFSNFGHWPSTHDCRVRPQPFCCSGCSIGKAACQLWQTNSTSWTLLLQVPAREGETNRLPDPLRPGAEDTAYDDPKPR